MPTDISIYPSQAEQQLLEQKAAEYGMSIDEFVTWLINSALAETDNSIHQIIKQ